MSAVDVVQVDRKTTKALRPIRVRAGRHALTITLFLALGVS